MDSKSFDLTVNHRPLIFSPPSPSACSSGKASYADAKCVLSRMASSGVPISTESLELLLEAAAADAKR
jgi:hypothetical protein